MQRALQVLHHVLLQRLSMELLRPAQLTQQPPSAEQQLVEVVELEVKPLLPPGVLLQLLLLLLWLLLTRGGGKDWQCLQDFQLVVSLQLLCLLMVLVATLGLPAHHRQQELLVGGTLWQQHLQMCCCCCCCWVPLPALSQSGHPVQLLASPSQNCCRRWRWPCCCCCCC